VSKASDLTVTFAGLGNIANFSIAFGTSVAAPTTLAGLAFSEGAFTPNDALRMSFVFAPDNTYSGSIFVRPAPVAGAAVGNNWWVCIFNAAAPAGTAVPGLTMGPFVLVA